MPTREPTPCPACAADRGEVPGWCPACGHHERISARDLLWWLTDGPRFLQAAGDEDDPADPLRWPGYPDLVRRAREERDLPEAVMVAEGRVQGGKREAVFVAWDFGFLGGSMGSAVGEAVAQAFEYATKRKLPIVLLPSTGGARMQEGMASLVQMAKTAVAAEAHARGGLLRVAVLRDPTTGGVFASHANLCDIVLGEPGATIGFAGPRVAEAMTGGPLPEGSHTATGAQRAGLIDHVVARPRLREALDALVGWTVHGSPQPVPAPSGRREPIADAWTQVQRARAADRPRARSHLSGLDVRAELRGDRAGSDDPAVRVLLARLAGRRLIVVALDREANEARITPAGYRKAWRGFALADQLGVPLVTLIDTPGADAGAASEAGGIAHHIAQTFAQLLAVRSPVVALVIGEGGSGGALAFAVADRLLIQEHATFSVIAPEGAAAILHRDRDRAAEVAPLLRPTARALRELGIADAVVPEPEGASAIAARAAIAAALDELADEPWPARQAGRRRRWRKAWSGVPLPPADDAAGAGQPLTSP